MTTLEFENPWALLLLFAIPAWWWFARQRRAPALVFSRTALLGRFAPRSSAVLARAPGWLRGLALAAVIVAIAAPRTGAAVVDIDAEGIAIMLVVDVSSSMLAEDFAPDNRLAVARNTVASFIGAREYDRIGMVAFGGEAITMVPLTIDYAVLFQAIDRIRPAGSPGWLADGTAIGTAVATATNRLRRAPGESKVIILLTDGENNRGEIDPRTAARAAAAFGIRIHTIGVGSDGVASIPVARGPGGQVQYASLPVSIDEPLLREMAAATGGEYFRARDEDALQAIYRRIDEFETTTVQVSRHVDYTPRYLPFLLLAMAALLGEWTLRASRWGRVP
jgi:Ca-activated chloride channel family protein